MKMLPLQLVVIDLENGRRGVFVGTPLIRDDATADDCQVENVWFTAIHQLPANVTLAQLTRLAHEQIAAHEATLQ
jgi:hypothetical protein